MSRFKHTLLAVLLVSFAAGTVIHVTNAATMSMKMASAAAEGMHKGDCDQCPKSSSKASSCNGMCGQPLWATAVTGETLPPVIGEVLGGSLTPVLECAAVSPDPYPPRSLS